MSQNSYRHIASFLILILACISSTIAQSPSWQLTSAAGASPITAIIARDGGLVLAATISSGILKSIDGGLSWAQSNAGLPNDAVLSMVLEKDGTIFAGINDHGVFRSQDNGGSWTVANTGITGDMIDALAVAPNGTLYAGNERGVFASANDGNSWQQTTLTEQVWAMTVDKNGYVYASSPTSGAFRSTDGGSHWIQIPLAAFGITAMMAHPTFDYVFAASSGIYRSSDQGISWAGSSVDASILMAITVSTAGHVYIGGDIGVMRSTNLGLTWDDAATGLGNATIQALGAGPGGVLYAGTTSGQIFKSNGTSSAPMAVTGSGGAALRRSIPNPTTGLTAISLDLPRREKITVSIHSMLGETVTVLARDWFGAGEHELIWDGSAMPAGQYFCRMTGSGISECRVITVVH